MQMIQQELPNPIYVMDIPDFDAKFGFDPQFGDKVSRFWGVLKAWVIMKLSKDFMIMNI